MKGSTARSAFAGAFSAILAARLTKAATKYSGRCVEVRKRSDMWRKRARYL